MWSAFLAAAFLQEKSGMDKVTGCLLTFLLLRRESYTESLTSSIENHAYENGRRYHSFRAGSMWILCHQHLFSLVKDQCLL